MIEKKAFKCETLVLCIQAQNAQKMALTMLIDNVFVAVPNYNELTFDPAEEVIKLFAIELLLKKIKRVSKKLFKKPF
ncbi:hypothetical protein K0F60_05345 [Bacteroides fragilis]|uniref:hypothetical protein n=1 Tax=Bacteroides TaxID=816 RepID=UPI0018799D92|nr:hypothetical protein [Bacteroides fragilis]MBE7400841.1 hypothetical protein [Bacteroides fragilis]MCE8558006.1 hypothetical protein [Bacteroides fragilis]